MLIHSINIKHCGPFKNATLQFEVDNKVPIGAAYSESAFLGKTRLMKAMHILSANGMGKTTLCRAVSCVAQLLSGAQNNPALLKLLTPPWHKTDEATEITVYFEPNFHSVNTTVTDTAENESSSASSSFKIALLYRLEYQLSILDGAIVSERLRIQQYKKNVENNRSTSLLFSRTWNSKKGEFDAVDNFIKERGVQFLRTHVGRHESMVPRYGENMLRLYKSNSITEFTKNKLKIAIEKLNLKIICDEWKNVQTTAVSREVNLKPSAWERNCFNLITEPADSLYVSSALRILKQLGCEMQELRGSKEYDDNSGITHYYITCIYQRVAGSGEWVEAKYEQLSFGLRKLICLSLELAICFRNRGAMVLDDGDSLLHPHVLAELVGLFYQKEWNPLNAQLMLCSHEVDLLRYLDKYQQHLIVPAMDIQDGFCVLPLSELSARATDNYFKKYHEGKYGGLPILSNRTLQLNQDLNDNHEK
ncbi:MAG: hypothetical protein QM538_05695 [Methylacidiphilales bacterium]|nr:hypothetical protein [Candidatus Methylacidiphilales bacterium]